MKRDATRWKKHKYNGNDPLKRIAFDKTEKAGNKLYKQGYHVDKKTMEDLYKRFLVSEQHNKTKNLRKSKKRSSFFKRLFETFPARNSLHPTKDLLSKVSYKKKSPLVRVRLYKPESQIIKSKFDNKRSKISDSLNKAKPLIDWTSEFFKSSVLSLAVRTAIDIEAVVVGVAQVVGDTEKFLRMVEVHPDGKVLPSAKEFEAFVALLKEYKDILSNLVSLANDFRILAAL